MNRRHKWWLHFSLTVWICCVFMRNTNEIDDFCIRSWSRVRVYTTAGGRKQHRHRDTNIAHTKSSINYFVPSYINATVFSLSYFTLLNLICDWVICELFCWAESWFVRSAAARVWNRMKPAVNRKVSWNLVIQATDCAVVSWINNKWLFCK